MEVVVPELQVSSPDAFRVDLERRLPEVPSTALVRGLFFNMIEDHLRRAGHGERVRSIVGPHRRIYALHPVRELLDAFALAGPLVVPGNPEEGIRQIWAGGSRYFASSWLGRAFQSLIRPDPASALAWLEGAHGHFCNYGRWRLERVDRQHVVLHMFDEYIWIASAHRGGCEGLLAACGVDGQVEPVIESPFSGWLDIQWRLRD
jgi:uncharacterized protein (TIGR02265 family)